MKSRSGRGSTHGPLTPEEQRELQRSAKIKIGICLGIILLIIGSDIVVLKNTKDGPAITVSAEVRSVEKDWVGVPVPHILEYVTTMKTDNELFFFLRTNEPVIGLDVGSKARLVYHHILIFGKPDHYKIDLVQPILPSK